jgi:hypothetical protein
LNRGLKLPLLGHDDETADIRHIKHIVLSRARERGARYGLEYAEKFHFVSPGRLHFNLHTGPWSIGSSRSRPGRSTLFHFQFPGFIEEAAQRQELAGILLVRHIDHCEISDRGLHRHHGPCSVSAHVPFSKNSVHDNVALGR